MDQALHHEDQRARDDLDIRRYNITSEGDLRNAVEKVAAYVEGLPVDRKIVSMGDRMMMAVRLRYGCPGATASPVSPATPGSGSPVYAAIQRLQRRAIRTPGTLQCVLSRRPGL